MVGTRLRCLLPIALAMTMVAAPAQAGDNWMQGLWAGATLGTLSGWAAAPRDMSDAAGVVLGASGGLLGAVVVGTTDVDERRMELANSTAIWAGLLGGMLREARGNPYGNVSAIAALADVGFVTGLALWPDWRLSRGQIWLINGCGATGMTLGTIANVAIQEGGYSLGPRQTRDQVGWGVMAGMTVAGLAVCAATVRPGWDPPAAQIVPTSNGMALVGRW